MIRREIQSDVGSPQWLLISQVEHARIAGELAEHWGREPFLPLVCADQLLPTIYHHDDGWTDWEQSPEVDSQTGRPLSFTEMPLEVSLDIWAKSIRRAEAIGPLAAWVVAGHFMALLGHSHESQTPSALAWLSRYRAEQQGWLFKWQSEATAADSSQSEARETDRSEAQAELALGQLQMFDLFSLWLCMARRTEPRDFATPLGIQVKFTPERSNALASVQRQRISLSPWPLVVDHLPLSATGRVVPVKAYSNSQELAEVPHAEQTVSWELVPR